MKLTTKQLKQIIYEELTEVSYNQIVNPDYEDLWTFTKGLANQTHNAIQSSGYRAHAFKPTKQPWPDGRMNKENYIIIADDDFHEIARIKVFSANKFTVHSYGKGFVFGKPEVASSINKLFDILEILTPPQ